MREIIEQLESIHAVAVGDGAFYVTECGMGDFNRLLKNAVAMLRKLKPRDSISLEWMSEKRDRYLSCGDYIMAATLNDLVKQWQREKWEAQTHAETSEAAQ
ncbi:MAG: hypothetical protein IJ769_00785 [Clostridia bacterium]|nr:hypothetical protein [Clostridia bacterium]